MLLLYGLLRTSAAEMVVGRLPVLFMDEISTGLDSASTFLITKALKNLCGFIRVGVQLNVLLGVLLSHALKNMCGFIRVGM